MLGEKIKEAVEDSGLRIEDIAAYVGVSAGNFRRLYKKDSTEVKYIIKIAEKLDLPLGYFLNDETISAITQTASGTGNIAGSGNKQKVQIGHSSAVQSTGMTLDDLMMELKLCVSERDGLKRELDITKNLLQSREEMIAVLKSK